MKPEWLANDDFLSPVTIQTNTTYVVSVHFPNGQYPTTPTTSPCRTRIIR